RGHGRGPWLARRRTGRAPAGRQDQRARLASHAFLTRGAARVARRARSGDAGAAVAVSRSAVFLDRDGVLVEATVRDGVPQSARSLADFQILPGVAEACERLHQAGFALIVVTNQPDVARGILTAEAVEEMHRELRERLPL